MKRVTILGSPGTGKTTFAKALAQKTGLPLIHLDLYYHDTSKNYYHDEPAWQNRVRELLKQDEWIMDGNYNSTLEARVARADTVFYFDFPRRTAFTGVFKRRIVHRNKPRDDMPSDWKESTNWQFLQYVWRFNADKKPKITAALTDSKRKTIVVFKNRVQVKRYLES